MARIVSRREVLRGSGAALAGGLAGCASSRNCGQMDTVVVRATLIDSPREDRPEAEPVAFADLSAEEQNIVRTAIDDPPYEKCFSQLDSAERNAVDSLDGEGCYIRRGDAQYRLSGAVTDNVFCS